MDEHGGNPLPAATLDVDPAQQRRLKGPITTPVGEGFRSVNVALRKKLDLYAQVRPCKTYPGVRTRYEDVDLVIVRETTEDIYAGIEFEQGSTSREARGDWLLAELGSPVPRGLGHLDQADLDHRHAAHRSSSPSTTRARWAAARSRPCTRRTS